MITTKEMGYAKLCVIVNNNNVIKFEKSSKQVKLPVAYTFSVPFMLR